MVHKTESLLKEISVICKEKHYSLVTAESCTGGGLAYLITKHPNTSSLLERGYITYSVSSKNEVLDVSNYLLQTCGPVSKEVAMEMAKNALSKSKAQISIAITGVDHESIKEEGINKPGIAWISFASTGANIIVKSFQHSSSTREAFCEKLIAHTLKLLVKYINTN